MGRWTTALMKRTYAVREQRSGVSARLSSRPGPGVALTAGVSLIRLTTFAPGTVEGQR